MPNFPPLAPGLYIVSTPIGALGDLTLRAHEVLSTAPTIAAEDTRTLRKLLNLHGIATGDRKVIAYHDHSSMRDRARVLELARTGAVALVSDAGTPMVADPGYALVREAAEAGVQVIPVPGASSVLAALSVAGLPTNRFLFEGFLPTKSGARAKVLAELATVRATLVFFEAPSRVAATLEALAAGLGAEREVALCRELTKRHEQVVRGTLGESAEWIGDTVPAKGEFVLVVGPPEHIEASPETRDAALREALARLSVRDAAREVAEALNLPRKDVYKRALELTE